MSDSETNNLRKRLHFLQNRAPKEFEEVQEALNLWAGSKLTKVTTVPPELLLQFQGQMQMVEQILTILKDSKHKPID